MFGNANGGSNNNSGWGNSSNNGWGGGSTWGSSPTVETNPWGNSAPVNTNTGTNTWGNAGTQQQQTMQAPPLFQSNVKNGIRNYDSITSKYRMVLKEILVKSVREQGMSSGLKFKPSFICTLRGDNMSLTMGIELSRHSKAPENLFVCNSDIAPSLGSILNREFFDLNPTTSNNIQATIRYIMGTEKWGSTSELNEKGLANYVNLVSKFVDELSDYIINRSGVFLQGNQIVVPPLVRTMMEAGFDFLGLRIVPNITSQGVLVFNYTFDEELTNDMKMDKWFFKD